MDLIAVVMGCKDSDTRFEQTKQLLDYGFSSFMIYQPQQEEVQAQLTRCRWSAAHRPRCSLRLESCPKRWWRRDEAEEIEVAVELVPELQAPVLQGDSIGTVSLIRQGETLSQEAAHRLPDGGADDLCQEPESPVAGACAGAGVAQKAGFAHKNFLLSGRKALFNQNSLAK